MEARLTQNLLHVAPSQRMQPDELLALRDRARQLAERAIRRTGMNVTLLAPQAPGENPDPPVDK
jgi:hypothetical protein